MTKVQAQGATIVEGIDKSSFQGAMQTVYNKFVTTPAQKALLQKIKALS